MATMRIWRARGDAGARRCLALSLVALAALWALAAPAGAVCTGDCDGDERVTVSELIRGVNIALGLQELTNCPEFDADGNGRVSIGELIGGVNASLEGCPLEPVFPADYRDSYVEVRGCRGSIEHGGVSIRVLADPVSAGPYLDQASPLPVGSIVVKEEYDGDECEADGVLVRWRAMRKEEAGFDPDDGDWHWQWVEPDRSVTFDDKATCITCHRVAECVERDYMCTHGEALASGQMRPVLEELPGALLSVTGTAPDDVYAVGADPNDGMGPLILHYDGAAWQRLQSGANGDLWWISLDRIDGSYFLVGAGGLILSLEPTSGVFTPHTTPDDVPTLFGVWGASSDEIWAVGGNLANVGAGGVMWRYDGATWSAVDLSAVRPGGIPVLYKVWGRAADDIYAVGDRGFALHYDGEEWSELATGTVRTLFTVHGNADLTAASGGFFSDAVLQQAAPGGAFTAVTPSGVPQLNGVFVTAEGAAAAVGLEGSLALRREGVWSAVDTQLDTLLGFHAVWVDAEGGIWAVGGDLTTDLDRGMLAYSGKREIAGGLSALRRGLTAQQARIVAAWESADR